MLQYLYIFFFYKLKLKYSKYLTKYLIIQIDLFFRIYLINNYKMYSSDSKFRIFCIIP